MINFMADQPQELGQVCRRYVRTTKERQSLATFEIDGDEITDAATFHDVFARVFDFPEFYGRNMDAWNDCMSDLHGPEALSGHHLTDREPIDIQLLNTEDFAERCPDVFRSFVGGTAFVNRLYEERGEQVRIALILR